MKMAAGVAGLYASRGSADQHEDEISAWDQGVVRHILAAADHSQFLVKASFAHAIDHPPELRIGRQAHTGIRSDTAGEFWQFRITGLSSSTRYRLQLVSSSQDGRIPLCDPWDLATFPAPDDMPDRARILMYTCAGGDERSGFLPLELRSRLLRRGLSFNPNAFIANGDHIYNDLRPQRRMRAPGPLAFAQNRTVPVLGSEHEELVKTTGNRQIRDLYGTDFRSVPAFFIQDDHDFFDNDEATDRLITFPPDPFMSAMARATQRLYYPEFLLIPGDLPDLPGRGRDETGHPYSECFGTVRFGRLLEALLYTVRKTMTLDGEDAVFLDKAVERWFRDRMASDEAVHLLNVPSGPFGWTAGKWGEWYPDRLVAGGGLSAEPPKNHWQPGWLKQHDRLLRAMSAMPRRIPLIISGDLHATAAARIIQAGDTDLSANPVYTALCGTIGTGSVGWTSRSRGTPPVAPLHLAMEELIEPTEMHGFTIADFTPDTAELKFYLWDQQRQSPDEIDQLEVSHTISISRN